MADDDDGLDALPFPLVPLPVSSPRSTVSAKRLEGGPAAAVGASDSFSDSDSAEPEPELLSERDPVESSSETAEPERFRFAMIVDLLIRY